MDSVLYNNLILAYNNKGSLKNYGGFYGLHARGKNG